MKFHSMTTKGASLFLAALILFSSCASTTMIQSTPDGAKLYLNGESVGTTPYSHRDTKIVGSTNTVRLEKEGYETLNTSFSRNEEADVGAIIGGILVLIPFLWTMKYKPVHNYEMIPLSNNEPQEVNTQSQDTESESKAYRLRELKALLDDKIITQEEFESEKQKILEVDN
ncbi:MAG TPA: PEGA domain-containing protein [Membranihabitans sp.]|nr:PEGA domain-containing protein [Membranihabitans sp.]